MTSITWAGPRCVQEAAAILAPQNRTQGRCEQLLNYLFSALEKGSRCYEEIKSPSHCPSCPLSYNTPPIYNPIQDGLGRHEMSRAVMLTPSSSLLLMGTLCTGPLSEHASIPA